MNAYAVFKQLQLENSQYKSNFQKLKLEYLDSLASLKDNQREWNVEKESLAKTIEGLKRDLLQKSQKVNKGDEENQALIVKNRSLRLELQKMDPIRTKCHEQQVELDSLQFEITQLKETHDHSILDVKLDCDAQIEQFKQDIAMLERENSELKETSGDSRVIIKNLGMQLSTQKTRLNQMMDENQELREEIAKFRARKEKDEMDLRRIIRKIEIENSANVKENLSIREEIEKLRVENSDLRVFVSSEKIRTQELIDENSKLLEKNEIEKISHVNKLRIVQEKHQEAMKEQKKIIRELREELDVSLRKIEQRSRRDETTNEEKTKIVIAKMERDYQSEIQKLQNDCKNLRVEKEEFETRKRETYESYQEDKNKMHFETKNLRLKCSNFEIKNEELETTNQRLADQFKMYEQKVKELKLKILSAEKNHEIRKIEHSNLLQKIEKMRLSKLNLTQTIRANSIEMKHVRRRNLDLSQDFGSKDQRLHLTQIENQKLRNNFETMKRKCGKYRKFALKKKQELSVLNETLLNKTKKLSMLEQQNDFLSTRNSLLIDFRDAERPKPKEPVIEEPPDQ